MDTQKPSRRGRERLQHRQEILKAALALFSEKGFHNVSMQEIGQRAEFATGTLYNFFQNKDDLYRALMRETADEFHAALTQASAEGPDGISRLFNWLRAKREIFVKNVQAVRLYLSETRGTSFHPMAGLEEEIRRMHQAMLQEIAAIFEEGIAKGVFAPLDPLMLALGLDAISNAALFLWLEQPERYPAEATMEGMMRIFLERVKIG
jgi:AcrR family transcriptional regulator